MEEISLSEMYSTMQTEMLQILQTGAAAFAHPGAKGDNTEVNWIEWFRKYLPSRYAVDKAFVIDSTGKRSEQIDLVMQIACVVILKTQMLVQMANAKLQHILDLILFSALSLNEEFVLRKAKHQRHQHSAYQNYHVSSSAGVGSALTHSLSILPLRI